jgi:hypothetical protein
VSFGLGAFPGYCAEGTKFKTADRIPEFTNALMAGGALDYWATLGDNWYDPKGDISQTIYAKYSLTTLQAFNVVIPGNHDYWSFGPTIWPSPFGEQCGNGFMQWNAMDTMAAKNVSVGDAAPFFDFSVDPSSAGIAKGEDCAAKHENMNFYQQLGNVAIIGYTGASTYSELLPFLEEACAAVGAEPSVEVVFLVSHWDNAGGAIDGMRTCSALSLGVFAPPPLLRLPCCLRLMSSWKLFRPGVTGGHNDSATPAAFARLITLDGCKQFHTKRMLKWVTGHTHCNTISPYESEYGAQVAEAGYRVSGMGMSEPSDKETCRVNANGTQCVGCEVKVNFGFPIFDTTNGRLRILYFDTNDDAKYNPALDCVMQKGWRGCEHESYVTVWLDTPIVQRD